MGRTAGGWKGTRVVNQGGELGHRQEGDEKWK